MDRYQPHDQNRKSLKRDRSSSRNSPTRDSRKKNDTKTFSPYNLQSNNLLSKTNQDVPSGSTANHNTLLGSTTHPIEREKKYQDAEIGFNRPSTEVRRGQFTDSRRDPDTRMLDTYSRMAIKELPKYKKVGKTPHLAATFLNDKIHIAGNSGKKHVRSQDAKEVTQRMSDPTKLKPATEDDTRKSKDTSKLLALKEGKYHSEDRSSNLNKIQKAIKTESIDWHQLDRNESGNGSKHGEMALHQPILQHARNNRQNGDKNKISIPIAGVKKDCILCHWAHDILNKYVYADLGYEVTTSGTHGNPFPGWIAPQELLANKEALNAFKEELQTLNTGGEKWSIKEGKVIESSGKFKLKNNPNAPYESASEAE